MKQGKMTPDIAEYRSLHIRYVVDRALYKHSDRMYRFIAREELALTMRRHNGTECYDDIGMGILSFFLVTLTGSPPFIGPVRP